MSLFLIRTQKKSNVLIFQERFFLKYCEKAQKNRPQAVIVAGI
jgi:hypothetical protein